MNVLEFEVTGANHAELREQANAAVNQYFQAVGELYVVVMRVRVNTELVQNGAVYHRDFVADVRYTW